MARGGSSKESSSYSNHDSRYPSAQGSLLHYILIALVIATLIVSIFTLSYAYQFKKLLVPNTVNVNDFLKKLTAHDEMKSNVGIAPLNVVQISSNNLGSLQAQISGLDTSHIGNFIVQYTDKVVIYDYDNDQIKATVSLQQPQQAQLPADFFAKLNKHAELKGLENEKPIGGQFDQASLNTLKQQFPDVYADAKLGDFLLRYATKLIIYDYNANKIIKAVNLSSST